MRAIAPFRQVVYSVACLPSANTRGWQNGTGNECSLCPTKRNILCPANPQTHQFYAPAFLTLSPTVGGILASQSPFFRHLGKRLVGLHDCRSQFWQCQFWQLVQRSVGRWARGLENYPKNQAFCETKFHSGIIFFFIEREQVIFVHSQRDTANSRHLFIGIRSSSRANSNPKLAITYRIPE